MATRRREARHHRRPFRPQPLAASKCRTCRFACHPAKPGIPSVQPGKARHPLGRNGQSPAHPGATIARSVRTRHRPGTARADGQCVRDGPGGPPPPRPRPRGLKAVQCRTCRHSYNSATPGNARPNGGRHWHHGLPRLTTPIITRQNPVKHRLNAQENRGGCWLPSESGIAASIAGIAAKPAS